jgi:hypothetical protein
VCASCRCSAPTCLRALRQLQRLGVTVLQHARVTEIDVIGLALGA